MMSAYSKVAIGRGADICCDRKASGQKAEKQTVERFLLNAILTPVCHKAQKLCLRLNVICSRLIIHPAAVPSNSYAARVFNG